ncbi:phosphoribosylamine--glycine ligase [Prosthecochloris sp. SCSIO W1103]|uniref:phosphoribosylamine--glycine ligase n=1 Tax=Prosthecochloris sp. SCSIO W1103 TaxID=2992244 RepID=UPI00223E7C95|nr:phosphoribosylamine--glycine ligase [Prosthecochloris sp. SCSIO W1103]UZJ37122.1 phosphoribosylamine--glycine ligase [Prosthecochloris sp. SCSIO W1103]
MKVLIVGGGGREHALAWAIARSEKVSKVYVAPGNGGTATMGSCVENVALGSTDVDGLLQFAVSESVDLTVVGPEQPLEAGIVDLFAEAGKKVFGPTKSAAQLETSKVFAKDFMSRHEIPTASYEVFRDYDSAKDFLEKTTVFPQVIKASGLAAGKGVVVAETRADALQAIDDLFEKRVFGGAADEVVIESFLAGQEASVFAITDGTQYRFFLPSQDHKRIGEGDTGKNTGGMGAYAPAPLVSEEVMKKVEERVIVPTLEGMREEGMPYTGFLYIGLMIDNGEPSVVEYNARLGDPEAQVVLPLIQTELVEALEASLDGNLGEIAFEMKPLSATTVVLASEGYPGSYEKGKVIEIDPKLQEHDSVMVFHAGTVLEGGMLKTSGGRVLSVTALAPTLGESIALAYSALGGVAFDGSYYRRDIGAKALA